MSPLDWGFGHTTRLVPLITELKKTNVVILGVCSSNLFYYEELFPELQKIELPSYRISYARKLPVWLKILLQWPRIKAVIKKENKLLDALIRQHKIDVVISDNRYGLFNKSVPSILITHQLSIRSPFFASIANKINLNLIHRFTEVWVPDYEAQFQRLSGDLSQNSNVKIPIRYIGPQSSLAGKKWKGNNSIDILIILSGIEPQRTLLEEKLIKKFEATSQNIVLVRGTREGKIINKNIKTFDFVAGKELAELINNAITVICRSGYSTLMDLHLLEKEDLILVPTPGQTEQEYLAAYWKVKFNTRILAQNRVEDFELVLKKRL